MIDPIGISKDMFVSYLEKGIKLEWQVKTYKEEIKDFDEHFITNNARKRPSFLKIDRSTSDKMNHLQTIDQQRCFKLRQPYIRWNQSVNQNEEILFY